MAELVAAADDELRARWESLQLGYTESQGLPELRAEIAALYEPSRRGAGARRRSGRGRSSSPCTRCSLPGIT